MIDTTLLQHKFYCQCVIDSLYPMYAVAQDIRQRTFPIQKQQVSKLPGDAVSVRMCECAEHVVDG